MKLDFNIQVNQRQGLTLTAQVQQAIKLLHMTNQEIQEFVHDEFQENPFVETGLFSEKNQINEHKKNNNYTLVFFESPKRVLKTLKDIKNIYSDEKNLIITRELTKIYEEINDHSVEGHIKNLISNNSEKIKGEHVFIIPATLKKKENKDYFEIEQFIITLLENDIPYSKAIKVASTIYKVNKSQIYKKYIKLAKKLDKD